jgi:hypothetical protein
MAWNDTVNVADEYFHKRSDDPYWSENSLLGFTVPERNCLYYGWDQHLAIPGGAEMFDFDLSNSLSCKMIQPQREYQFGYDRHGVRFDLTWTAFRRHRTDKYRIPPKLRIPVRRGLAVRPTAGSSWRR